MDTEQRQQPAPPDTAPAGQEDPASDGAKAPRGGAKLYGAFSVETFCNTGSLTLTHDDTAGFLAYAEQFTPRNFWFTDAGVKVWAYGEDYDNWQDTYGMDSSRVLYHCGHGGMDANGVFYVPMGAPWLGDDCTATSSIMRLGNEYARYVFWSTCSSLRVLDGHSPFRTWKDANLGLRMMFGFETVSWDDARYGSGFWRHWQAGESLSSAWLNSSWDIAHDQAPSVCATGASPEQAQDRLFNERYLSAERASTDWWWWRWYDTASSVVRAPSMEMPHQLRTALLAPPNSRSLRDIAGRFNVQGGSARTFGSFAHMAADGRTVTVDDAGLVSARLNQPNLENRTQLSRSDALAAAGAAVRDFGLDEGSELVLDRVASLCEGGVSARGDGHVEDPFTTGTLVQYRQLVNGLPVITTDRGMVRINIDNDGRVTDVYSGIRPVEELSDKPRATTREPAPPGGLARAIGETDPQTALARAFGPRLRTILSGPQAPVSVATVPESTEVGYDIQGSHASLVARKAVELEFAGGFRKRYWINAPLFD
ncbi:DUF6345 domain-containing protein [Arthrobacter sp. H35-D1]|uniref:DUF6345 domain-containing protein n=1 Tax=Arthrobacter sp. H35-D1 TaxID=3046202 RepID=UPI0024BA38C3|nr:DUF6345 domain-containing protein [Arthrobacter sp. H35-D1]MDJ0314651.1 DUF6345 domain-containing protein [Arthrobacter sp. H35-D1]